MTNATQDFTLNCGLNLNTDASLGVAVGRQLLVDSPVGGTRGFTVNGGTGTLVLNSVINSPGNLTVETAAGLHPTPIASRHWPSAIRSY